jgi:trimethylamine--corrinoid protein Co-methyltransferase
VESQDLQLNGESTYVSTVGAGTETLDFESGVRRSSNKDDVAKTALIADYLEEVSYYWPMVSAQDFGLLSPLHELDAAYNNTTKHVQTESVVDYEMAKYSVEIAKVIADSKDTFSERPPLSLLTCTIAPLAQDKGAMEAALVFAEAGLPTGFMAMGTTGSTAPATIAGTISQNDAEIVAAMILIQMAYPGAPVYYSSLPGMMHPNTGAFLETAWDIGIMHPIGVELAHEWGVPSMVLGFSPDESSASWGYSISLGPTLLLCSLVGAEMSVGMGELEAATLLFKEGLVLDTEIYNHIYSYTSKLETSEDEFATAVINEIGPNGHYLRHKHTRKNLRYRGVSDLVFKPDVNGGYCDPIIEASKKTDWILENHEPQPLPDVQKKEIKMILASAEAELGLDN